MRRVLAVVAALAFAGAARAEVTRQDAGGFAIRNVAEVTAAPDRAYAALGEVGRWWNGAHSYTGDAANLSLPLQAGACFCEALPGGGVAHGRVVLAWPAQGLLRLESALGPLQAEGVAGALTFQIKPKGKGAEIVQTYVVGGGRPGLGAQLAGPVDQVLAGQLARLKLYLDTGKPD